MRREPPSSGASDASTSGSDAPRDDADLEGAGRFVEEGVRAAYTVLDSYLRQGRSVARKLGRLSFPSLMWGSDSRERQARLMELTGELAANWFDLVGLVTESLLDVRDSDSSSDVKVAYDVASARPALVELEFMPGKATTRIRSHGLQSLDASIRPIPACFDARDDRRVVVQIRVPGDQAPGLYTGVVLAAESGQIVGALSLELR